MAIGDFLASSSVPGVFPVGNLPRKDPGNGTRQRSNSASDVDRIFHLLEPGSMASRLTSL